MSVSSITTTRQNMFRPIMKTRFIALILGVALIAAMATVYTQSSLAATGAGGTGGSGGAGAAAGHTKPSTVPPHPGKASQISPAVIHHSRQFGITKPPNITIKRGSGGLACWPYYWLC